MKLDTNAVVCCGFGFLFLMLAGCQKDPNERHVTLYSSVDATYTRQVISRFQKKTGIRVDLVSDTEAVKSTGLVNRLIAERERPVADVLWSGDPVRSTALVRRKIGTTIDDLPPPSNLGSRQQSNVPP